MHDDGIDVSGSLEISIGEFKRRCAVHIAEEQAKPLPDNAVIGLLCDGVRLAREYAWAIDQWDRDEVVAEQRERSIAYDHAQAIAERDEARQAAAAGGAIGPWIWQGRDDFLESMSEDMAIRITAGQLRRLLNEKSK